MTHQSGSFMPIMGGSFRVMINTIVQTIIDLGKNLNLKLIAEGVEDEEHWQLLEKMGCHEIQGYFYSRPLAEQPFFEFIKANTPKAMGLNS